MNDAELLNPADRLDFLREVYHAGPTVKEAALFLSVSQEPLPPELLSPQTFRLRLMRLILLRQQLRVPEALSLALRLLEDVSDALPQDTFFFYCELTRTALYADEHHLAIEGLVCAFAHQQQVPPEVSNYLHMVLAAMYSYLQNDQQQLIETRLARPVPPLRPPFSFAWDDTIWLANLGWVLGNLGEWQEALPMLEKAVTLLDLHSVNGARQTLGELLVLRAEFSPSPPSPAELDELRRRVASADQPLLWLALSLAQALSAWRLGQYPAAHQAFQQAIAQGQQVPNERLTLRMWTHALTFYRQRQDQAEVIRLLEFSHDLQLRLRERATLLLQALADQASEALKLRLDLALSRAELIERLAAVGEYRDDITGQHTWRVAQLTERLAEQMGLSQAEDIGSASRLHDLGKVALPDHILLKPGPLTPEERIQMQQHTLVGAEMLAGTNSHLMQLSQAIARSHHERWDGLGYPDGLSGEAIPLAARIVAVADVFDALIHKRPYKAAWDMEAAIKELQMNAGKQFDPHVIAALNAVLAEGKDW